MPNAQVTISMDGAGRAMDNVFIERLWRTIKYNHIHLNPDEGGNTPRDGVQAFLDADDEDRPHSSLGDSTSDDLHNRTPLQQRSAYLVATNPVNSSDGQKAVQGTGPLHKSSIEHRANV